VSFNLLPPEIGWLLKHLLCWCVCCEVCLHTAAAATGHVDALHVPRQDDDGQVIRARAAPEGSRALQRVSC